MAENGTLFIVGIGPGAQNEMSGRALETLSLVDTVVGYKKYIDIIAPLICGKRVISNGMTGEIERCRQALEIASKGNNVALVCSGDAGVYGMASPLLEIAAEKNAADIEIVSGISASMSGAALLGSPIAHDFATISLSDALTPWKTIEKRLKLCAKADMCIVLYNPMSHKREDTLFRACEILLKEISTQTVCGIAQNIGRDGEKSEICTLQELQNKKLDMFSTVFIGNSTTKRVNIVCKSGEKEFMVTPRGYIKKYEL